MAISFVNAFLIGCVIFAFAQILVEIFKLNPPQMLTVMLMLASVMAMAGYYGVLEKIGFFGAIYPIAGLASIWAGAVKSGLAQGNMFAFSASYLNAIIVLVGAWVISMTCAGLFRKH